MAHRVIKTHAFAPDPFAIIAEELATMMEDSEVNARRVYEFFWGIARGQKGAPLPKQDLLRDNYFSEANLHPGILQTHFCYGSIRSGKTVGVLAFFTEMMLKYPGTRALGARRTMAELHNSLIHSLEELLTRWQVEYRIRRGDNPHVWFPNGSEWILMSTEKADNQRESKADTLGGIELSLAFLEEANEIKKGFYDTVLGRLSQKGLPARAVFVVENPPPETHWTYREFMQKKRPGVFSYHFSIEDNRINLGDEYVDSIIERYKDSPTLFKKYYLGEFTPTIEGEPIFRGRFFRSQHVASEPLEFDLKYSIYRCWDFGFLHPAVVLFQDNIEYGQIRVLKSTLGSEETIDKFATRQVNLHKSLYPGARYIEVADVAGRRRSATSPQSELEVLQAVVRAPVSTRYTKIEYGISVINEQLSTITPILGQPAIIICPAGANILADAFEFGYTQDPDSKQDVIKPRRDMLYEHVMDAFRYGVLVCRTVTSQKVQHNPERKLWRMMTGKGSYQEGDLWKATGSKGPHYGFGRKKR